MSIRIVKSIIFTAIILTSSILKTQGKEISVDKIDDCFITNSSPVQVRDSLTIDSITKEYFAWKDPGFGNDTYLVKLLYKNSSLVEIKYITLSEEFIKGIINEFIYTGKTTNDLNEVVDSYSNGSIKLEIKREDKFIELKFWKNKRGN